MMKRSEAKKSKKAKSTRAQVPKVVTPEILEGELAEDEGRSTANSEGAEGDEGEVLEAELVGDPGFPVPAGASGPDLAAELEQLPALPPHLDPFKHYLRDVSKYPLLSPEDEFALAVKLRDTGDIDAAKRLVQANLRLVVKIAMEYRSAYQNILDLVQEGNVGLMKAVSKYDPSKGARLGYYASWWIRSYILKYILDNFRQVRVGTTAAQKKLFFHLMREKERLEAQGLEAGPKLLAEKLNV
ncbi:MAG TPA: sigma-70 family RNA polymerase sigma factor, partial [Oligoflexia bacterium]|nr:sigma-70 family RNA polymerase sigma factor [Oligoflexia bacterium]